MPKPITDAQFRFLLSRGYSREELRGVTAAEAIHMVDAAKKNPDRKRSGGLRTTPLEPTPTNVLRRKFLRPTWKQRRVLNRYGLHAQTCQEASDLIGKIAANGWELPEDIRNRQ